MPRYKEANYAQGQFVSIQFEHQIFPGSFEHALSFLIDHAVHKKTGRSREGGTGNFAERELDYSLKGCAGRGTAEVTTDSPRPARERCWPPSKNESHDPGGTSENMIFLQTRWAFKEVSFSC